KRGISARTAGKGNGLTSRSSAGRSPIGTVHKLATGLVTVATNRRPSAVPAPDVYFSSPKLTLRAGLRWTSRAHNQGPEPFASSAVKRNICELTGVGEPSLELR